MPRSFLSSLSLMNHYQAPYKTERLHSPDLLSRPLSSSLQGRGHSRFYSFLCTMVLLAICSGSEFSFLAQSDEHLASCVAELTVSSLLTPALSRSQSQASVFRLRFPTQHGVQSSFFPRSELTNLSGVCSVVGRSTGGCHRDDYDRYLCSKIWF